MSPSPNWVVLVDSSNTGAEGNRQPSSTSWFTSEPILCSMMPGEINPSEANICVDLQQLEGGSFDSNHLTHPAYNENQSGQVVHNPEPGLVFVTLENAPMHRNVSICHEEVVTTLSYGGDANPELELLYASEIARNNCKDILVVNNPNQVATSVPLRLTTDSHRQGPLSQAGRNSCQPKSQNPCHCTKSKCLKLYCECFSRGVMCNNCKCAGCHNNHEHNTEREKAMKTCLVRNPDAFKDKRSGGKLGVIKGCRCKRSGCLKNYCECYEVNIRCTPSCKCLGCRNYDMNLMGRNFSENQGTPFQASMSSQKMEKTPVSVITSAVVETVTGCLLTRAAVAEREQRSEAWAQHEVLSEFGLCLIQIVKAMAKKQTS